MSESIERRLEEFASAINRRLDDIDSKFERLNSADSRISEDIPPHVGRHVGAASTPPLLGAASQQPDLQGEFQSLRDSLGRVKIPADLKVNDSRQGIKRADQPLLNVISKCGRYSETGLKLLCTLEVGQTVTQEVLDNLFLVHHAQVKFLQEEFASLVVSGQFDSSTAKIFRSLQKNTSGFNSESLETLRSAASLSAAGRRGPSPSEDRGTGTFGGRGRGYFGSSYGRGGRGRGYNSYRGDVFQSFANRQFPRRRDESATLNGENN